MSVTDPQLSTCSVIQTDRIQHVRTTYHSRQSFDRSSLASNSARLTRLV